MRVDTDTGPDILRKCVDRVRGLSSSTAEVERHAEDADDDRDNGERPNGSMRSEVLRVERAKVSSELFVSAHCVSHASTSVHAGQRRADQRQKYCAGLNHHEPPASASAAENPRADDLHHIANWRRRRGCRNGGGPTISEENRSPIFEEITKSALNHQLQQYCPRDVALRILCF